MRTVSPTEGQSPNRLDRPLFGEIAQELLGLTQERLDASLEQQRAEGGRLGEILRRRNWMTREQSAEVLRTQARCVALALQTELRQNCFPYPAFYSLCLPAFNECDNIEDTLDAACAILPVFVRRFEVMVVDDGSVDGTGDVVARYAQREPRVRLIRHPHNRGYGGAVTSGLQAAKGELVSFMDSDGQFSLLDLPRFLLEIDNYDLVIGYRRRRADHWMRRMNAWGWNRLIRFLFGVRVRDLDCAFKLFRREVLQRLVMTSTGAAINAELMIQCQRGDYRIRELPVEHYTRCHGAPTGAAFKVIAKAFRELKPLWKYRTRTEPAPLLTERAVLTTDTATSLREVV